MPQISSSDRVKSWEALHLPAMPKATMHNRGGPKPPNTSANGAKCGRLSPRRWLDVNQHVGDLAVGRANLILHFVRDLVAAPHRHIAVDHHVQVDIVVEAHLADEALI